MNDHDRELQVIESVRDKGPATKFLAYSKLSGPGWLQGAITLGGGSLAGALYLGVTSGYGLMWVQPLAMICGVIMLCAIAYVTLSTGEKPFGQINRHLHPLLGWSWIIATIMANIVWCMPQFALATAAIQQNLIGMTAETPKATLETSQWIIIAVLFCLGLFINYLYQSEGKGAKVFDLIIKILVGIIVLSFMAVVVTLATGGALNWGKIFGGFIPDLSLLFKPSAAYADLIAASSDPSWWKDKIASTQKDVIFTAFGTAVGINMTFILPYTLLKKRWGSKHRGLSMVDLSIGLFIPFFIATGCVLIASSATFHTKTAGAPEGSNPSFLTSLPSVQSAIIGATSPEASITATQTAIASLPQADRDLSRMLFQRDADALALTLEPLAGKVVAQKIFGIGVLGMAVSTIIILMLMNGVAFQELFGKRDLKPAAPDSPAPVIAPNRTIYFLGCIVSGLAGASFPLFWTGASKAALAVPTSVIGGSLIPIAYFTFFLLMNSKKVLGDKRPEGTARIIWNCLMIFATSIATLGSVWAIKGKAFFGIPAGTIGIAFLVILFAVGLYSFLKNEKRA